MKKKRVEIVRIEDEVSCVENAIEQFQSYRKNLKLFIQTETPLYERDKKKLSLEVYSIQSKIALHSKHLAGLDHYLTMDESEYVNLEKNETKC